MKKILKLFGLFSILSTCLFNNVEASTYKDYLIKDYYVFEDVYVTKKSSWHNFYDRIKMIVRASDNQFVYCIEPGEQVNEEGEYVGFTNNYETVSQMTTDEWSLVSKIAYYGYGYTEDGIDHTDKKWYAITQYMIWKAAPFGHDIYFTDKLKGEKIEKFEEEIAEINDLIEKHPKAPKFSNIPTEMVIGETITLTDSNGVLSKYDVTNSSNVAVTKNGNNLNITALSTGNVSINFSKKLNRVNVPRIVYTFDDESQRVLSVGYLDPVEINMDINVIGGSISIKKVDSETNGKAQGNATLGGAKYDILDSNKNRIATLTTDENGEAKSNNILIPNQTYYLKEVSASNGYLIDTKEYPFLVTKENLNITMTLEEDVIKNYISILKQYEYVDENTTFLNAEFGIIFEIFNPDNTKYGEIVTDKNGYASINLPYGVYRLSQKNTTEGYEKIYDFYVTVDENSEKEQYYNILNNKLSAYLRLKKVDSETGKTIALPNTKFKILNTDTNQYVSQYVSGKVFDNFYTDEFGNMTTYLKLEAGNYRIVEVEAPQGYLLSTEGVDFTIGSDTKYHYTSYGAFVLVEFKNKPIKGQVEIFKSGDNFVVEDGTFKYETIKLDGVKYEIYASEDIVSSDGQTLYYKQGDLVEILTTNSSGYAISKQLPLGKYYAIERETKEDYVLDEKIYSFELAEKDNRTAIVFEKLETHNYLKKGRLEFTKTDLVNGMPIPNVEISIYTENDELVYNGFTDENGLIIIDELKVGKYYILEKNPATGYLLNEEKVIFEILENGDIIKAEMTNELITGDLEFTKTDLVNGTPIPNTLIEIRNSDTNEVVFYGHTDMFGKITVKGLKYGKYTITEIEPAKGYILSNETLSFDILENGSTIKEEMTNRKIFGTLEFSKVDSLTKQLLGGATIKIENIETGEVIYEGVTNDNEKIIINNIIIGKYRIYEISSPESYIIAEPIDFEINEDGKIINITMENEKMVIEVPSTGKNDDFLLISGILLALATGTLISKKIKKNGKKVDYEKR